LEKIGMMDEYDEKIAEYMKKDYTEKIGKLDELDCLKDRKNVWLLPHFPVTNVNKPAAAKFKEKSLDDLLVASLFGVLCRFRRCEVAIVTIKDPWLRYQKLC
jgi:hypothetical protein